MEALSGGETHDPNNRVMLLCCPLLSFEDVPICPVSLDTNCSFTPQYTRVDTVHHDPPVPPPEATSKSYAASGDVFHTVTPSEESK